MRLKLLSVLAISLLGALAGCDSSTADAPTASTTTNPVTITPVSGVYISGKVVDPTTGSPVSGVRVGLKKSRLFTHTDKNGKYVIASANVIAARVAARASASDSTQTYVDTTHQAVSDTAVPATVTDSVRVQADTTTLASTEVYSKVDSAVPQFTVVQRNFGGNFQPYAPAGVKVWLEVYKNDSVKTPITNQKLGLMTAMASGTIPGYSGFVYFKYNKDETYDFTVRVMVWNKDSSAITTGSDYISCESNVGDVTIPTLNGSGYLVPSQFLIQGYDTVAVDSSFKIKLAQVGWNGINWHIDTGATLQYTYKFPTTYAPAMISAGKYNLFNDVLLGMFLGDTSGYGNNGGYAKGTLARRFAHALTGINAGTTKLAWADSLLWYNGNTVSWYWPAYTNYGSTSVLDSVFKLTVSKDSLLAWAQSKGIKTHLWDSAYKAGLFVYRDTVYCGKGAYAVKTKDSSKIVYGLEQINSNVYSPVYEFLYSGAVAPTAYDSVTLSAPAPRWMLSDTQGVFDVPVPAELKAKLKSAEDNLAAQTVLCPFVLKDPQNAFLAAGAMTFSPATSLSWLASEGWSGIAHYAPSAKFTLTTKFANHLGAVIGTIGTSQALSVR